MSLRNMQPKIPLRILVRESGKLFLCFLFGTLLITSLQDFNPKNLLYKFITLSTLFAFIFGINTYFLYYFDQKRSHSTEKIWKKTFLWGYSCSLVFFFLHHIAIDQLEKCGVLVHANSHDELEGWKLTVFFLYANLVVYSFIFLIQNFVLHQYEKSRIQLELLQLRASNTETVNQLLQQQIQPHFLFNALNILKSLIRREPKSAEAYLLRLSDFLRVSISKNTTGTATIREELKVCCDYMEMQKIRFGDALQYKAHIELTDPVVERRLPFFSLQPLLENAIKHNGMTQDNPLLVEVSREGDYITVRNNLQPKQHAEISTGNGHSMLKKRYKTLIGEEPVFREENGVYSVSIKIL